MKFYQSSGTFQKITPWGLSLFLLPIILAGVLILSFYEGENGKEWLIAMAGIGLYAWINVVIGFFTPNWKKFTIQSLLCFIGLIIVVFPITWFISQVSFFEMREYKLLFSATVIFYFMALTISRLIRSLSQWFENN